MKFLCFYASFNMYSIAVLLVCSLAVSVQGVLDPRRSCVNTKAIFDGISVLDPNGNRISLAGQIFSSLQQDSNTCELDHTCCSNEAELSFKNYIAESYRDKILSKLSDRLMGCHNHSFSGELKAYIESCRVYQVNLMTRTYGAFFYPYITIFDKFYGYLQSSVDSGNICTIDKEWFEMFYEVYLAVLISSDDGSLGNAPQTEEFKNCFYQYFIDSEGSRLQTQLNVFLRTFRHTMRYLRALKTLDKVVESMVDFTMEDQCKRKIMKMTHCSSCAGYSDSTTTCDGFCLNVLRGCLVDLADLFEPLQEFGDALVSVETQLNKRNGLYYLWGLMPQLSNNIFQLVSRTYSSSIGIRNNVISRCAAGNIGKREAPAPLRVPRGLVNTPDESLSESASCLINTLDSLKIIPDDVCDSVPTAEANCWNGQSLGSYGRAVIGFDKDLQIDNPEMNSEDRRSRFKQEIANLEYATRELKIVEGSFECDDDDEDEICTVPDTCNYYNITNNAIDEDMSGSTISGSATTSPPEIITTTPIAETTPSESTTQTTSRVVDTTASFPGPGDPTNRVTDDGDFDGQRGGATALLPGVTILLLSLLSLLL